MGKGKRKMGKGEGDRRMKISRRKNEEVHPTSIIHNP